MRFALRDVVRDTDRAQTGAVVAIEYGLLRLKNPVTGRTWPASPSRCTRVRFGDDAGGNPPQFPAGTRPMTVRPGQVRVNDYVMINNRAYSITDLRVHGPDGRTLILQGRSPWVMKPGIHQIYRPQ